MTSKSIIGFFLLLAWMTCDAILCAQAPPKTAEADQQTSPLLSYLDRKGNVVPVTSPSTWEIRRIQILEGMQEAMGPLPDRDPLRTLHIQAKDSVTRNTYSRYTIHVTVAEGEVLPAYLYLPEQEQPEGKVAAMVVLHGTGDGGKDLVDGKSPLPNRALAKELAERGYVVIAPDYPSMGDLRDYDFSTDRYESATMKGIFNHMRCVDVLQGLPMVDAGRIGVIGHSLGGHNAMFLAAFDRRVKVAVASCGWTLMDYYNIGEDASKRYGGRLGPWAQDRYMPLLRTKFNLDASQFPFDFDEVIAAIAPRPFFSNSPTSDSNFDVDGVRRGIASAAVIYKLLGKADNLQVRYPDAGHDFPTEVRQEAYRFVDRVLKHDANKHEIE